MAAARINLSATNMTCAARCSSTTDELLPAMKHTIIRNLLLGALLQATLFSHIHAQSALTRRLDHSRRLDAVRHVRDGASSTSAAERTEYFRSAYQGEWKLELESGAAFDTNAFADANARHDWHWDYAATLGYEWWVSEELGLVLTPSIFAEGSRFDTFNSLNSNTLGTGLTASIVDKLPVDVELSYAGAWGFDGGFSENVLTQHDVALIFGKIRYFRQLADGTEDKDGPSLEWRLGGGYVFSNPAVDDAAHADAEADLTLPLGERLTLTAVAGLSYLAYTDASADDREAWIALVGAGLEFKPWKNKNLTFVTGVTYAHRFDTDETAEHDQLLASLSVKFEWEHMGFNLFKK